MQPPAHVEPGYRPTRFERAHTVATTALRRRLWLPRTLYVAIPWIYLGVGVGSLVGGLFLPETAWLVPYLVLLGVALTHAAAFVATMRHRPGKKVSPRSVS